MNEDQKLEQKKFLEFLHNDADKKYHFTRGLLFGKQTVCKPLELGLTKKEEESSFEAELVHVDAFCAIGAWVQEFGKDFGLGSLTEAPHEAAMDACYDVFEKVTGIDHTIVVQTNDSKVHQANSFKDVARRLEDKLNG